MRTMLKLMDERLSRGEALVLLTITAASGATPRGAGARMLVGSEGRICGTVGGGAVEYRAQQLAQQALAEHSSLQQSFSLTRNDVEDLGMICGGEVDIFFHYIPAGDGDTIALARQAETLFARGDAIWLLSDLSRGGALSLYTEQEGFWGDPSPHAVPPFPVRLRHVRQGDAHFWVEQIHSAARVFLFGGGHVSQELVPLLSQVGFRCVVLEDRPEFARKELFPTAEEVLLIDFGQIADHISICPEDYVCVMTRGHSHDTVVQAQVLKCHPCYVGVIGSRRKAAAVRAVLKEQHGLTEAELDRVTTPIGLEIGAETPAEVAISIAAQMIALRAKKQAEEVL